MCGVVLAVNLEMIASASDEPRGPGQPSKYRPEYCEQVIEHCREGKSFASFAASIEVSRETIHEWRRVHPKFSDACARAATAAQTWWEEKCQGNVSDRNFNSRLAEFMMSARFEDYRPSAQRIELTGANGTPLIGRSLTRDELLKLAAPILDAEIVEPKQIGPAPDPPKTD